MNHKRWIDLATMTTGVAIKEIENLTLKLFLSKEDKEEKNKEIQQQIAEIIFSKMSRLRGTGAKVLQALSLDEDLLPEAYVRRFESAYDNLHSLSRPVVKKVFRTEFGKNPEDVFLEFNYSPLAAASLGQVHGAKLDSGESIVVKIQYPNVAQDMRSDFVFLKTVAGVIGNPLIKSSIEELSQVLIAETDYRLEAENIEAFLKLEFGKDVCLPKVVSEYSSERVLTLTRLEGTPLYQENSDRLRNEALQRIFNFFFHSLKFGSCIHADPHPGNFLVAEAATGIVDFGCVKRNIHASVKKLFLLLLTRDAEPSQIVDLYAELGADVSAGTNEFYEGHVRKYHDLCTSIIGHERVHFESVKTKVTLMRQFLFTQSREVALQGLSSDFTMLHKAFQSLLFMLCKYRAIIDTRAENYVISEMLK